MPVSFHLHPPPEIILFLGRFHPLLVHLPIGMLVALAALEVVAWIPRFKNANASAGFTLALATPSVVASAICGWLLSLAGGYDEPLLAWHQWLGTGTAAAVVAAAILFWRRHRNAYRASLFVAVGLLMATGHLGGSLTHGSDYLTRYAPWPLKSWLGPAESRETRSKNLGLEAQQRPVFAGFIAPIFESKCASCHGPEKAKGGLRLDSWGAVFKGGEGGVVILPGQAARSPLVQRIRLPNNNDDHMPPMGKPQLSAGELAVLEWWIDAGAPDQKTVAELKPTPAIQAMMSALAKDGR